LANQKTVEPLKSLITAESLQRLGCTPSSIMLIYSPRSKVLFDIVMEKLAME